MRIRFRNPVEISFEGDDWGIKRMVFKFVVAGIVIGAAATALVLL